MHQKFIDERRDKEEQLASLEEYYERELDKCREEADRERERMRIVQEEYEKIIATMKQRDEDGGGGVDAIDFAETKLSLSLQEREDSEQHLRQVIADKKAAYEETSAKLRESERIVREL